MSQVTHLPQRGLSSVGHDVPEERPGTIMDGRTDEVIDLTRSNLRR